MTAPTTLPAFDAEAEAKRFVAEGPRRALAGTLEASLVKILRAAYTAGQATPIAAPADAERERVRSAVDCIFGIWIAEGVLAKRTDLAGWKSALVNDILYMTRTPAPEPQPAGEVEK